MLKWSLNYFRKTPYFPQMGDEVIYFRQGHELYVEAVVRESAYKIDLQKGLPWHRRPALRVSFRTYLRSTLTCPTMRY